MHVAYGPVLHGTCAPTPVPRVYVHMTREESAGGGLWCEPIVLPGSIETLSQICCH